MRARVQAVIGIAVLLLGLSSVLAGDPKKPKKKHVKADNIASMTSRVVGNRWHNAAEIAAINLIPYQGNDDTEELVGFVEFGDGGFGIYVAHEDEDDDEWVTLTKSESRSEFLQGVLRRSNLR